MWAVGTDEGLCAAVVNTCLLMHRCYSSRRRRTCRPFTAQVLCREKCICTTAQVPRTPQSTPVVAPAPQTPPAGTGRCGEIAGCPPQGRTADPHGPPGATSCSALRARRPVPCHTDGRRVHSDTSLRRHGARAPGPAGSSPRRRADHRRHHTYSTGSRAGRVGGRWTVPCVLPIVVAPCT